MKRGILAGSIAIVLGVTVAVASGPGHRGGYPIRPAIFDNTTYFDANNLLMFVTNTGSFASDKTQKFGHEYGLYYPKGTDQAVMFAGGVWLGATVNGQVRVSAVDFGEDFVPGPMVDGKSLSNRGSYRVYKVGKGDATAKNTDRRDWPFEDGAPAIKNTDGVDSLDLFGNPRPLILGDQALWSVFNDGDPSARSSFAGTGSTAPLGVEVQSYVWGYARSGALGQTLFMRLTVINKGDNLLEDMYLSLWNDCDVGDYQDDLVGCDTTRSLGFAYNSGPDGVYGDAAPAVGIDFFQGPIVPGEATDSAWVSSKGTWVGGYRNLPMTSFNKYINGTDPLVSSQSYNYMQGFDINGDPQIDPTTGQPTKFVVNGDPVSTAGWLDDTPDDRRFMMSTGPFTMAPGDTQEVVAAILVGQGANHLASVTDLKRIDDLAQSVFDANFNIPGPPPAPRFWAVPHKNAIQLLWGVNADGDVQEGYGTADPLTAQRPVIQEFVMEGYNLYQGASMAGPWTKIATYDVANDVSRIYNDKDNPDGRERIVAQYGTNSGLVHELWVTQDRLSGGALINNKDYYFAITAYNYDRMNADEFIVGENTFGIIAESFENLPGGQAIRVTPASVAGVLADTADHVAGISGGMVLVDFFDQNAITGDTYRVTFNEDGSWNLVNASEFPSAVLLESEAAAISSQAVDGMVIRVLGPSAGVSAVREVVAGGNDLGNGVDVNYALNSTGDWYMDPGGSHTLDEYIWAAATQHDYEIRFIGGNTSYCWDWWGYQDTYSNVWSDESGDPIGVPLEIWDVTDGRQITFMLIDKDASGDFSWGDKLYIRDINYDDVNWLGADVHSGQYVDDFTDLHYGRITFYDYSGNLDRPTAGTIVRIATNKPNQPDDVFEFTTAPPGTEEGTVVGFAVAAVRPVPNPAYNETEPIKFVDLPAGPATIRIFNLAGDLIRTLTKDDLGSAEILWDMETDAGFPVASGLYIYHVHAEGIGTKTGKIAVFTGEERLSEY